MVSSGPESRGKLRKAAGEGAACLALDSGSTVIGCHVRPTRQGGKK
jgi:hypothetical protein